MVAGPATSANSPAGDAAVARELFASRFTALAREMGEMLRRTAVSTNVKERLDFSCAVLDPRGRLVVNAPHIPVHLGALGLCVRAVAEAVPCQPGDVVVTNHPAFGGSHLPDVTLVTPVFEEAGEAGGEAGELLGWVASRAHHAEIGGSRPGSMPPEAGNLEEEGVVLPPWRLVRRGEPRWREMRRRLTGGRHPSRAVAENLADLAAALAANHRGATGLCRLARAHGRRRILEAMADLRSLSEGRVAAALVRLQERLGGGPHRARHTLDDGTPLAVAVELAAGTARFDFTGTGDVHPGNLNAPPAVVTSVVLYILRLLLDEPLPLNEGLLAPVALHLPPGSLVNPPFPDDPRRAPAVVGGNVETSQRLVNLLLEALGLAAGSQGTMNNVLFGNESFGYYETVCGGTGAGCSGAGDGFAGTDAVHSHMTNTRITDPEVLEHRYPVRLEAFRIRRGSGGCGRFRGGDGVERRLRFLEDLELSVVSQHRDLGPHGLRGGEPGSPGSQWVERADGSRVRLGAVDGCAVGPGDVLVLETPGGGGCGRASEAGRERDR